MKSEKLVIDMQNHYIPSKALKLARKTDEFDFTYSINRFVKAYALMTDIDQHLSWMENAGVDMAILSTAAFAANGYEFCRVCNDGYGEIAKAYPDRFRCMIHVYPKDPVDQNRDEIKRCVEELGLYGIGVVSSYRDMNIDSPLMDPIWEAAVQYNMPVFVHPPLRNDLWGGEKYELFLTASREYDVAKSFIEIVYNILPRYPQLKVIMPHLAGGVTSILGRILSKYQPAGLTIPAEYAGQWIPFEKARELGIIQYYKELTKNMLYDTAGSGGWSPAARFAVEVLGAEQICFGTDYPYDLNHPEYVQRFIEDIRLFDITVEDKNRILGGNLARMFRIG
jgi:predicted TIM-barrel fold metal-dependent hydrolase